MANVRNALYEGFDTFGFCAVDGTFPFLLRVHQLLPEGGVLLDYGAGRGAQADEADGIKKFLLDFRNRAQRVIGVDVDPVVLENPFVHEAFQVPETGEIPLEPNTVDVAMLDWVCEHLADPAKTFSEIFRVVKPGGWIALRTPNRWHYSMIASQLIPDSLHARVLARVQEGRAERDVFAKRYRANTPRALRHLLRDAGFESPIVMSHEPEPVYLQFNSATFALGAVYQRIVELIPAHAGRLVLMAFGRKPLAAIHP